MDMNAREYFEAAKRAVHDRMCAEKTLERMRAAECPATQSYDRPMAHSGTHDPMDKTVARVDYEQGDFKVTIEECDRTITDAWCVVRGVGRLMGATYSTPLARYYLIGDTLQQIGESYDPPESRQTVKRAIDDALEEVDIVGITAVKEAEAQTAM